MNNTATHTGNTKAVNFAVITGAVLFSLLSFTVFAFVTFFFINFIGIEVEYSFRNFAALFLFVQFRQLYKGFIKGIQDGLKKYSQSI